MRALFVLVLVVGMGLAGFAVYMVNNHLTAQKQANAALMAQQQLNIPTVEVYAVNREIAYGEPLTMEDVVKIHYAKDFLPEGSFASEEELFPEGTDVVRIVTRKMEPNEPVLAAKVTAPGEVNGISGILAPGLRAFTINVDQSTGVSGFLQPGNRVDVYWTGSVDSLGRNASREITKLIKTGVELIAVNQSADASSAENLSIRTVTVQVSPGDVADLATLQSTGTLSLSLVGQGDTIEVTDVIETDMNKILGIEAPVEVAQEAPVEAPRVCTIRQRSGTEIKEIPIPCSN
ncbi:pilus assembly protein CpaB [Cognatiyoonia sediminum]|uniref:Pilus assembly protein CpaB n=1 Tax=Cognatiyoonia sediminum TaxID=1508389 RepID=A0A1M5NCD3_9RHOB|nr:Flp pilus assembly protein CpaB [Cognatiyoonia sediminum]SHG87147.1 pilus assembly protein CpaB [Cognatiyoonia sediminum]